MEEFQNRIHYKICLFDEKVEGFIDSLEPIQKIYEKKLEEVFQKIQRKFEDTKEEDLLNDTNNHIINTPNKNDIEEEKIKNIEIKNGNKEKNVHKIKLNIFEKFNTKGKEEDLNNCILHDDENTLLAKANNLFLEIPLKEYSNTKQMIPIVMNEIKNKKYENFTKALYFESFHKNQCKLRTHSNKNNFIILKEYCKEVKDCLSIFYFDLLWCIVQGKIKLEKAMFFIIKQLCKANEHFISRVKQVLEKSKLYNIVGKKKKVVLNEKNDETQGIPNTTIITTTTTTTTTTTRTLEAEDQDLINKLSIPFKELILNSIHYLIEILEQTKTENQKNFETYKHTLSKCIYSLEKNEIITYKDATMYIENKNFDSLRIFNKEISKLITKMRTKHIYSICVFNLIREDVAGYTKICYLLECFFSPKKEKQKKEKKQKEKKEKLKKWYFSKMHEKSKGIQNNTKTKVVDTFKEPMELKIPSDEMKKTNYTRKRKREIITNGKKYITIDKKILKKHMSCYYCNDLLKLKKNLFHIAGVHNLCPRRILSILLLYYELYIDHPKQLLPLLYLYSKEIITNVILLELKMRNHYVKENEKHELMKLKIISKNEKCQKQTFDTGCFFNANYFFSVNYFKMCSILILNNLLCINSFYTHLLPNDLLLKHMYKQLYSKFYEDYNNSQWKQVNTTMYNHVPFDISKLYVMYERVNKSYMKGKFSEKTKVSSLTTPTKKDTVKINNMNSNYYFKNITKILEKSDPKFIYDSLLNYILHTKHKELKQKYEKNTEISKDALTLYLYDLIHTKACGINEKDNLIKNFVEREIKLRNEKPPSECVSCTTAYNYLFLKQDDYFFVLSKIFFMSNPKFLFLSALIDLNAWNLVVKVYKHMQSFYCNPFLNYFVNTAFAKLLIHLINPFETKYVSKRKKTHTNQSTNDQERITENTKYKEISSSAVVNGTVVADKNKINEKRKKNEGEKKKKEKQYINKKYFPEKCVFCNIYIRGNKLCSHECLREIKKNQKYMQLLLNQEKKILHRRKQVRHLLKEHYINEKYMEIEMTETPFRMIRKIRSRVNINTVTNRRNKKNKLLLGNGIVLVSNDSSYSSYSSENSSEDSLNPVTSLVDSFSSSSSSSSSTFVSYEDDEQSCLRQRKKRKKDTNQKIQKEERQTKYLFPDSVNVNFNSLLNFFITTKEKNKGLKKIQCIEDFFESIVTLLKYLGYFGFIHTTVLKKILNILYVYVRKMNHSDESSKNNKINRNEQLHRQFDNVFIKFLFFYLTINEEQNKTINKDIWRVLKELYISKRYTIYYTFLKKVAKYKKIIEKLNGIENEEKLKEKLFLNETNKKETHKDPKGKTLSAYISKDSFTIYVLSMYNFELIKNKVRKIIKRSTSDILKNRYNVTVQNMLYEFTTLININPFVTSDVILQQCELFDSNMIITLSESIKNIYSMSSEIFLYRIIERQQMLNVHTYSMKRSIGGEASGMAKDMSGLSMNKPKKLINLSFMSAKFLSKHPHIHFYPLIISSIKRIFSEFNKKDTIFLRKELKYGKDEGCNEEVSDNNNITVLRGENEQYPNELIGYIYDLEYIQKIIEIYGGVVISMNVQELTEDQLNAQCGYMLLKEEIMNSGETLKLNLSTSENEILEKIETEEEELKKLCLKHVIETMINPNIIYLIFSTLSKLKYEYLFDSNTTSLKNISSLFDKIHEVLILYIEFLQNNSTPETFRSMIPSVKDIFAFFDTAQVFHILRYAFPFFVKSKKSHVKTETEEKKEEKEQTREGKEEGEKENNNIKEIHKQDFIKVENEAVWKDVITPVISKYLEIEQFQGINMNFYLLFWRLNISDIYVPHKQYQTILDQYERNIKKLEKLEEQYKKNTEYKWVSKKMKRLRTKKMNIKKEYDEQIERSKKIKKYIFQVTEHWVNPSQIGLNTFIAFVKYLISPRILNSEKDSLFCSKIIQLLIESQTPLMNICILVYVFTKMLTPLINTCTEKEALNIGIFFNDIYSYIYTLCNNIKQFNKISKNNPCFSSTINFVQKDTITHEMMIKKVTKWEQMIITLIFEKKNYEKSWINSKSVVIFFFRFVNSFPFSDNIRNQLKTNLQDIQTFAKNNGWKDIIISVNSLKTIIEKQMKTTTVSSVDNTKIEEIDKESQKKINQTKPTSHGILNHKDNTAMNPFNNASGKTMNNTTRDHTQPISNNQYMTPTKKAHHQNVFPMFVNNVLQKTYANERNQQIGIATVKNNNTENFINNPGMNSMRTRTEGSSNRNALNVLSYINQTNSNNNNNNLTNSSSNNNNNQNNMMNTKITTEVRNFTNENVNVNYPMTQGYPLPPPTKYIPPPIHNNDMRQNRIFQNMQNHLNNDHNSNHLNRKTNNFYRR